VFGLLVTESSTCWTSLNCSSLLPAVVGWLSLISKLVLCLAAISYGSISMIHRFIKQIHYRGQKEPRLGVKETYSWDSLGTLSRER
jgi:hypothetical protein